MSLVENATTVTFEIPKSEDFNDLQECYMVVARITKADGSDLDNIASDVAFSDNVAHTILKSVTVYLNTEKVTPSTVYQTYTNYFATRLGVGRAAHNVHLTSLQGITGENAGQMDAYANTTKWRNGKSGRRSRAKSLSTRLYQATYFAPARNSCLLCKT